MTTTSKLPPAPQCKICGGISWIQLGPAPSQMMCASCGDVVDPSLRSVGKALGPVRMPTSKPSTDTPESVSGSSKEVRINDNPRLRTLDRSGKPISLPIDRSGMHMSAVPTSVFHALLRAAGGSIVMDGHEAIAGPPDSDTVTSEWVTRGSYTVLEVKLYTVEHVECWEEKKPFDHDPHTYDESQLGHKQCPGWYIPF